MNKAFVKKEWIFWIVLLIPFIYLAFVWNALPDKIPIHWNAKGEPNGYSSKMFGGLIMPFLNIGLYLLLLLLPKIDPRKRNYASFASSFKHIRLGINLLFTVIYFYSIQSALGSGLADPKWIQILILIFLAFLGNYMRTVRPNWFIGIRTPWTMESPEVWKRTHDIGGKLFFYTGIFGIVFILIAGSGYGMIPFILVAASALYSVIYSFVLFKKLEKEASQTSHLSK